MHCGLKCSAIARGSPLLCKRKLSLYFDNPGIGPGACQRRFACAVQVCICGALEAQRLQEFIIVKFGEQSWKRTNPGCWRSASPARGSQRAVAAVQAAAQ
jgi:hypothetical protein